MNKKLKFKKDCTGCKACVNFNEMFGQPYCDAEFRPLAESEMDGSCDNFTPWYGDCAVTDGDFVGWIFGSNQITLVIGEPTFLP